jgi:hypothetical protein
VRLESRRIGEQFRHLPDQRIIGRRDVEAQAAGLIARMADVVGQVLPERGEFFLIRADQAAGKRDAGHGMSFPGARHRARHSHSMVPGGFDVMS